MRLAEVFLVGSLCATCAMACESDKKSQSQPKPTELSARQKAEVSQLETEVKELEHEHSELLKALPSAEELERSKRELEERKSRAEALVQRNKVVPCLVAELARIVSEGTSIDVVEIGKEGIAIELPVVDGSSFEPPLNACGALGAGKKIEGGWSWEAKLLPVDPPEPEPPKPTAQPAQKPTASLLHQLPKDPLRRLESLRSMAEALRAENAELRTQKEQLDQLSQGDRLLSAERSPRAPPDIPGTVQTMESFAQAAKIKLTSVRPESGNKLVRIYVEMTAKLTDVDALFVKLQTKPSVLVVEGLVLKPGDGTKTVPIRMTLASPRI